MNFAPTKRHESIPVLRTTYINLGLASRATGPEVQVPARHRAAALTISIDGSSEDRRSKTFTGKEMTRPGKYRIILSVVYISMA